MALFSLIAALLLDRARPLPSPNILWIWFRRYADRVARDLNAGQPIHGTVGWLAAVCPWVLATLVVFSTAALGRATGALPRWLIWLSYAVGIVELVNVTVATPTMFVFPAWIGLVSVVLLVRTPPRGLALATPTAAS